MHGQSTFQCLWIGLCCSKHRNELGMEGVCASAYCLAVRHEAARAHIWMDGFCAGTCQRRALRV